MAVVTRLHSAGSAQVERAAAMTFLQKALADADPARRLGRMPGWLLPDIEPMHCDSVAGNFILWQTCKPDIQITGTGNIVVVGPIIKGNIKGVINGNRNTVIVGGGVDRFDLRADIRYDDGLLFIGTRTRAISIHVVIGEVGAATSVLIGGESLLSRLVTLRATNSHAIFDMTSGRIIQAPTTIVVEPHVWIGEGATLLKGAQVGAGSIVAAGAMVTGAIPACVTCGGIPARVMRKNASWTFKLNPTQADIRAVQAFLKTVTSSR